MPAAGATLSGNITVMVPEFPVAVPVPNMVYICIPVPIRLQFAPVMVKAVPARL